MELERKNGAIMVNEIKLSTKTVNFEKAFIYKKFIKEENKFKDFTSEDLRLIKESDIKKIFTTLI